MITQKNITFDKHRGNPFFVEMVKVFVLSLQICTEVKRVSAKRQGKGIKCVLDRVGKVCVAKSCEGCSPRDSIKCSIDRLQKVARLVRHLHPTTN